VVDRRPHPDGSRSVLGQGDATLDVARGTAIARDGRDRQAAAWARALDGLDPSEMEGHGDAPALWLTDFAELLDAGVDR
jgi:hypothetical protein